MLVTLLDLYRVSSNTQAGRTLDGTVFPPRTAGEPSVRIGDQGFKGRGPSDVQPDEQLEDGGRLQQPCDQMRVSISENESFRISAEFPAGAGKVFASADLETGPLVLGMIAFITAAILWACTDKSLPPLSLMAGTVLLTWMHCVWRPKRATRRSARDPRHR